MNNWADDLYCGVTCVVSAAGRGDGQHGAEHDAEPATPDDADIIPEFHSVTFPMSRCHGRQQPPTLEHAGEYRILGIAPRRVVVASTASHLWRTGTVGCRLPNFAKIRPTLGGRLDFTCLYRGAASSPTNHWGDQLEVPSRPCLGLSPLRRPGGHPPAATAAPYPNSIATFCSGRRQRQRLSACACAPMATARPVARPRSRSSSAVTLCAGRPSASTVATRSQGHRQAPQGPLHRHGEGEPEQRRLQNCSKSFACGCVDRRADLNSLEVCLPASSRGADLSSWNES